MAYFVWSDEMSVGVKKMDEQHRKLVDMINTLHEAMLARKGRDVQKPVIDGMVDYVAVHFSEEEALMQVCDYKGLPAQKEEHERFNMKARELKERVEKAGFVLTQEVLDFLRDWLRHHIMGVDKGYRACLNDHGIL